jgi:hypothetical protein
MIMKAESHVVWSTKKEIDLGDPYQKKSYIQDVLTNGLASDVSKLDWEEIERILPYLKLPERVFRLWRFYLEQCLFSRVSKYTECNQYVDIKIADDVHWA